MVWTGLWAAFLQVTPRAVSPLPFWDLGSAPAGGVTAGLLQQSQPFLLQSDLALGKPLQHFLFAEDLPQVLHSPTYTLDTVLRLLGAAQQPGHCGVDAWPQTPGAIWCGLAWLAPTTQVSALQRFKDLERALPKGRIIQILFSSLDPQCNAGF